ncbi:hypothetical protein AVEN_35813-1 [Araneus ventricosus]|uniref:Uncharacterized protein n=1 Tax=Araneus ventricosus TaxID=182803 RepID=A0A4Y2BKH5_ARAVE|nr:hypothetical protein AVEN_35813-1 [Araneus ventricosus]
MKSTYIYTKPDRSHMSSRDGGLVWYGVLLNGKWCVRLTVQQTHMRGGSSLESCFEPSGPEADTLPLGHRSPYPFPDPCF